MALVSNIKFKVRDLSDLLRHGYRDNILSNRFKKSAMSLSIADYIPSLSIDVDKDKKYKNTNIQKFLNAEVIVPDRESKKYLDQGNPPNMEETDYYILDGAVIQGYGMVAKYRFKIHDLYSSCGTVSKYQHYFNPKKDISDLGFLNTIMPLVIKQSNKSNEKLTLTYKVTDSDLHCDTVVVDVGKHSKLQLVERICKDGTQLINIVYIVREGASLTLDRIIDNKNTYINCKVIQEPKSKFTLSSKALNTEFCYQELNIDSYHNCTTNIIDRNKLEGDEANTFIVNINHLGRESHSNIDSKAIVDDESTNFFKGNIFIDKQAENIDAQMLNKNLQVSKRAKVFTEPTLDILNKEVVCSHGCTISNIDEDELYYLQTKGLDKARSINIIKDAFLQ